jgi:hypothetical protein
MRQHVTVLGVLYIVLGAMGMIGAFFVLLVFGGAAGVVGTIAQHEPDAEIAVPILAVLGLGLSVFIAILSIPGIIAGIGLIKFRPWARILALVLSVLNLLHIPLGTVVGVYGLWVLLSGETEAIFRGIEAPQPPAPSPTS